MFGLILRRRVLPYYAGTNDSRAPRNSIQILPRSLFGVGPGAGWQRSLVVRLATLIEYSADYHVMGETLVEPPDEEAIRKDTCAVVVILRPWQSPKLPRRFGAELRVPRVRVVVGKPRVELRATPLRLPTDRHH